MAKTNLLESGLAATKAGSFLSDKERTDLISFVAGTGENYDRYLEWAAKRDVTVYTKAYFHRWVQKWRSAIQTARVKHIADVRAGAQYTRNKRLETLQDAAERLLSVIEREGLPVDALLKAEEQLRKTLESIAKETGEFNKPDPNVNRTGGGNVMNQLVERMMKALPAPPEEIPVEGEFEEIDELADSLPD